MIIGTYCSYVRNDIQLQRRFREISAIDGRWPTSDVTSISVRLGLLTASSVGNVVLIEYRAVCAGGWPPPALECSPSEMNYVSTLTKSCSTLAACKTRGLLSRCYDARTLQSKSFATPQPGFEPTSSALYATYLSVRLQQRHACKLFSTRAGQRTHVVL